jgi:diguanylate cyclase (GGDEF)-like protein/PAS domain S-box-containing protein
MARHTVPQGSPPAASDRNYNGGAFSKRPIRHGPVRRHKEPPIPPSSDPIPPTAHANAGERGAPPAPPALSEVEAWFRILAAHPTISIFVYRERFLYVNRGCEELTGYPAQELLGMEVWRLAHPDFQTLVETRARARLSGSAAVPPRYEFKIVRRDGAERWIEVNAAIVPMGGTPAALATAVDVTERKLAELALAEERERAEITLASIGDGVIRTDARGIVDYLNAAAERLTGWRCEEAVGQPLGQVWNVVDENGGKLLFDPVERCLREGRVIDLPESALLLRRDGVEFAIRDSVAPIRDRHGRITGAVLVFKDVTELRGMEREMSYLARHDALTGLWNRRELETRLEHYLRTAREEGREHAFFYLDLDEFKLVIDTCGHLAGDELLKQVAALLSSQLRRGDTLARLGGDEFGVLLEDTPPERAREIAEALRTAVHAHRFVWQERIFEVGVSLGTVMIDRASGDLGQILSAADAACYVAKEGGRNRVHEYQLDDTLVTERHGAMDWIHRIHKAFDEERFRLYRQPIQPLAAPGTPGDTGDSSAGPPPLSEIFIRMVDEEGRIASPAAFIPAAERYHLIPAIDRWVVHTAFAALMRGCLASAPAGTCFAINLSGQSIGEADFLDYVLAELAASGIPAERICFEITETAAVANLARARRFIAALKARGARFVLDDFGTGLSSFAYLKNLPVDFLKIDGEFVRDMVGDSVQRAMVEAIHQLGHLMGIRTIAEAVEDSATLEALRSIGVDYAQGYWIAAPEPLV